MPVPATDWSSLRVLVTAASRHQATAELAERIAAALAARGIDAEAHPIAEVAEIGAYDAVVLGSAVYVGRWLREARCFAENNAATLATMPVWLFSSGPIGRAGADAPADADTLATLIDAREHRVFAGRVDRALLSPVERVVLRLVRAPSADERDWDAVERFAADIATALDRERVPAPLHAST